MDYFFPYSQCTPCNWESDRIRKCIHSCCKHFRDNLWERRALIDLNKISLPNCEGIESFKRYGLTFPLLIRTLTLPTFWKYLPTEVMDILLATSSVMEQAKDCILQKVSEYSTENQPILIRCPTAPVRPGVWRIETCRSNAFIKNWFFMNISTYCRFI